MTNPRPSLNQTINDLLNSGYNETASSVIRAMGSEMNDGIVAQRLAELEQEAERLAAEGEMLSPDNPVLRAVLADMDEFQQRNQRRITDATSALTTDGVNVSSTITRQLVLSGMSDNQIAQVSAQWNRPDPQAVAALVDFTQDNAFKDLLSGYGDDVIQRISARATSGFVNGWGARRVARSIRTIATGLPVSQAETILRTLHLQSYRRGTAATQAANAHLLQQEAIRVAVLDPRTCLSCIALHGTKIPLGKPVADHWNGRCTSIAIVKGFTRNITLGTEWFGQLPPERQQQQRAFQNSPALYAAFADGAVDLNDFVEESTDPLFGEMVTQASLVGILGKDAQRYYGQGSRG
jgi:hypothetical protein